MATYWTENGQSASSGLSRTLFAEVRRALGHLYDSVYLQRSPLVPLLKTRLPEAIPPGQEGKALRKMLIEAIDQLAPGDNVPLRSEERRGHLALRGRYVEQVEANELAITLGVSERQLRRELHGGIEAVARIVAARLDWPDGAAVGFEDGEAAQESQMLAELEELGLDVGPVNLCAEVRNVAPLVAALAQEMEVTLHDQIGLESVVVRANRVVLRQVLLALYSWAIQRQRGQVIEVWMDRGEGGEAIFELRLFHGIAGIEALHPDEIVPLDLLQPLQATLTCTHSDTGIDVLRLALCCMPSHVVLLIDDNASLHHLFRRYLSGLPYRLVSAYDAPTGLALAQTEHPEVIVMDIMMPDRDGWELLHELKSDPQVQNIPVIVCSVLEQKALAKSLAVAGYLKKPVTQAALLAALGL